jgi:hypothetical protein
MKKAITGIMLAIMAVSVFSFLPNVTSADAQFQGKWVRMDGNIMNWTLTNGTTVNTFGWVVANAAIVNKTGTIQEWAIVHGIWSELVAYPMQPTDSAYPLGSGHDFNDSVIVVGVNFSYTFSFYNAKLVSLTDLSFNKTETGHDFYLAGLWNVSDITETINVTWSSSGDDLWPSRPQITVTWTETPVVTDATGTLVADWGVFVTPWGGEWPGYTGVGSFVLSIDGVGQLSGYAARGFQWLTPLNICDLGDATGTPSGTVNINDLVKVALHYGEAPGFSDYDPSLDVRGDGIIDIGDLTTIAANIQG